MVNTGFPGLLCLGEMAVSDNPQLWDFQKVTHCNSLEWVGNEYKFLLSAHKMDTVFESHTHCPNHWCTRPTANYKKIHLFEGPLVPSSPPTLASCQWFFPDMLGSFANLKNTVPLILLDNPCVWMVQLHSPRLVRLQSSFGVWDDGCLMHLKDTFERM
jgi:hypothetical protein